VPIPSGGISSRLRTGLFAATGMALPLFAFPPFRLAGRDLDLASVLAGLFVLACLPLAIRLRPGRLALLFSACVLVPLLAAVPPRPAVFSPGQFLSSYAHWLLVVAFFVGAASVSWKAGGQRRIIIANAAAALVIAAFALYQVFGIPRRWPGTGEFLLSIQREAFRFTRVGGRFFGGGYTRPTSLFLEPAWLGGYLAWGVASALGALLSQPGAFTRAGRTLLLAAAGASSLAILATVSWGAYGDFAVVLAATALFGLRRRSGRSVLAPLLFAIVLCAVVASPLGRPIRSAVAERWQMLRTTPLSGEDPHFARDSTWVRLRNVRHSKKLFLEHPARGIGLGQFRFYALPEVRGFPGLSLRDPWCGWLAIGAEMGFLGPVLLLAALTLAAVPRAGKGGFAAVGGVLLLVAAFLELHTGSYVDLWWWYPVALGAVLIRTPSPDSFEAPAANPSIAKGALLR
jgi:hypothetical protein